MAGQTNVNQLQSQTSAPGWTNISELQILTSTKYFQSVAVPGGHNSNSTPVQSFARFLPYKKVKFQNKYKQLKNLLVTSNTDLK